MPETGTPKIVPPPRSHTSTQQWQSFEVRMRRRRAERCLLRAEVALEAGFPEDARAAIEDARRHGAASEETADLEQRIAAAENPQPTNPPDRRWLVAGAALASLTVGAAAVWLLVSAPEAPPAVTPTAGVAAAQAPARPAQSDRVSVEQLVISPLTVNRALEEAPATDRAREPHAETAAPPPPPSPVTEEPPRPQPPVPSSPQQFTREAMDSPVVNVPLAPVTDPPPAVLPASSTVAPIGEPVEAAPVATTGNTPPPVDESARVRATLARYEAAYTRLDAAAARAVWPTVNQGALARAFEGLSAQRLSLGRCDVSVTDSTARAQCSGSASWTPRVGGGDRTASRRWTFDLRQVNGAWQITRAITR